MWRAMAMVVVAVFIAGTATAVTDQGCSNNFDSTFAALQKVGVKYHEQVDKKSFSVIAAPLQDTQAQELGKYAVQILTLVRGIK